jgi:DNA segregation ATPase FtsK/SpoIIIE-like protein
MEAIRLCEDSLYVSDVPITVPLRVLPPKEGEQESADYARYSIGICGQNHEGVYQYVWGMLVDYTAFQSPTDTRLYIIGSYQARENWRWAFSLPHCKETAQTDTLCFEEEQERRSEKDIDRVLLFWKNLRNTLERRKLRLSDKESGGDVTLPFMLIIVDTLAPLPEWSALRDLESEAAVSLILSEGDRLGAAILFLVPERNKVPSACKAVIEVDVDPKDKNKIVFRYAEVNLNTPRFVGRADLIHNQDMMRDFAKQLEPLQIRRG